jgi:hypothetical protein
MLQLGTTVGTTVSLGSLALVDWTSSASEREFSDTRAGNVSNRSWRLRASKRVRDDWKVLTVWLVNHMAGHTHSSSITQDVKWGHTPHLIATYICTFEMCGLCVHWQSTITMPTISSGQAVSWPNVKHIWNRSVMTSVPSGSAVFLCVTVEATHLIANRAWWWNHRTLLHMTDTWMMFPLKWGRVIACGLPLCNVVGCPYT